MSNQLITANWKCGCGNVNNVRDDQCNGCARVKDADMRILPGFIVTGLDAKGIAQHLSRTHESFNVMKAMCELYGLELRASEEVEHTLELVPSLEAQLGRRIAHTIAKAKIGQGEGWWMYNCTFRFFNDKAEVAIDGLTEAKQQGPGEAGSPSLKQTPAWWVGYSIGHTGRAPYHCIGPDKPPSQYANDSVHWTPLYTAPQVEAKRQDNTFFATVRDAWRVWMDENPGEDGRDVVTPFDRFLYGPHEAKPSGGAL